MLTMDYKLSALDAIHVSSVLEDCVDQLVILGQIMPGNIGAKQNEENDAMRLIDKQKILEKNYEELMTNGRNGNEQEIASVTKSIHTNTQAINKSMRRNKYLLDNGQKVQKDRKFIQDVLESTLSELRSNQTFYSLVDAVNKENEKKNELQAIVSKEEKSRKQVKQLQRAIIESRKEQEIDIQKRNELIAYLKDQLQESKAKTNMESRYLKKDAEVRVNSSQKKCQNTEQELKNEIIALNKQLEDESRCNADVESFLHSHHKMLEEKLEYWMEKYDADVELKQAELDALKTKKANDLQRLQELTRKFHVYSQVVEEDRLEKERVKKEKEREIEEYKACIKLQSWWRGLMVRRQLGPFKPKKKKGKKGGKSKKKK